MMETQVHHGKGCRHCDPVEEGEVLGKRDAATCATEEDILAAAASRVTASTAAPAPAPAPAPAIAAALNAAASASNKRKRAEPDAAGGEDEEQLQPQRAPKASLATAVEFMYSTLAYFTGQKQRQSKRQRLLGHLARVEDTYMYEAARLENLRHMTEMQRLRMLVAYQDLCDSMLEAGAPMSLFESDSSAEYVDGDMFYDAHTDTKAADQEAETADSELEYDDLEEEQEVHTGAAKPQVRDCNACGQGPSITTY